MKQFVAIFLFFACCMSYVSAQTFLDQLRTVDKGSGTVTVTQSKIIDELVNGRKYPTVVKQKKDTTAVKKVDKPAVMEGVGQHKPDSARHNKPDSTHNNTLDSTRNNGFVQSNVGPKRKVMGFRVQAFAGNNSRVSREKAKNIGERLKSEFPGHSVYVHFYSPRWVCRMGNYQTREEAEIMLQKVKDLGYSAACLVKGKITVH